MGTGDFKNTTIKIAKTTRLIIKWWFNKPMPPRNQTIEQMKF
jgi:hypothetical protein